ncbi:hypothetical protein [Sulfurimonas sp.]
MESEVNNLAYLALVISVISTIVAGISAYLSFRAINIMKSQLDIQSRQETVGYIKDIVEYLNKNPILITKIGS